MNTEVDTEVAGNTSTATLAEDNGCVSWAEGKKVRAWFLTINNFTEDDVKLILAEKCEYKVFQHERGEECGTLHLHLLLYYKNAREFGPIKKKWPTAHIEVVKNLDKCIEYCMKEDTRIAGPWEEGTRPKQGARSDLAAVAKMVFEGKSLSDISVAAPEAYVRYFRGIAALKSETEVDRDPDVVGKRYWIWGLSGVGKTKKVWDDNESKNVYIKDGTRWWDGYRYGDVICIDDFDGQWPFRNFLRLLDRYPYQGEVKGGYVKINSDIYITCEFPPEHFWEGNELTQVMRRLTEVIKM